MLTRSSLTRADDEKINQLIGSILVINGSYCEFHSDFSTSEP